MQTVKKSYNEEDIEVDIEEKNTSIRKAAFKYGIPFSTLKGRRNNNNASFKGTAVCRNGAGRVFKLTDNNEKIYFRVNNCCNADGCFTPRFVVYKPKRNSRAEWA